MSWSCGVVVITSALHAEGPQFDPGRDQRFFVREHLGFYSQNKCNLSGNFGIVHHLNWY